LGGACIANMRNEYKILFGSPEGKTSIEELGVDMGILERILDK
jgi:hypothetical protein